MKNIVSIVVIAMGLAIASYGFGQSQNLPEIRVGTLDQVGPLDPGAVFGNDSAQFTYLLFDSLVQRDHDSVEAVYIPGLALSWELIEDTVLELELRPDVTFHDGTPMTADDVKFSVERIVSGEFAPYTTVRDAYFSSIEGVEIVDDLTVRIITKRPDPALLALLSTSQLAIIPRAYTERVGFEEFGRAPIGTGPFRLTTYRENDLMVFEAFTDFWGEQPNVSQVTLRRIPEVAARITALVNGEVDIIVNVPVDQISTLSSRDCCEVREYLVPLFHIIFYNAAETTQTIMEDKTFRQALNLAIDRQLLVDALWGGNAVVPHGHQFPQYGDLYDPSIPQPRYDPSEAKRLLEESSYAGETIVYTASTGYTNAVLVAQAITSMWEEIGVRAEIAVDPPNDFTPSMFLRNWSNPMYFPDPAGSYGVMWSPTGFRVPGDWDPENPDYEEIYEEFRYSLDEAVRKSAYRQILEIAEEEAPFTILYQPMEYYGVRNGLNWSPRPGHQPYLLDFRSGGLSFD